MVTMVSRNTRRMLPNEYHTLQPTNTTSKSKIGKTDGSASSGMLYCLNKHTNRIDQQQAKANRFAFAG